MAASPTTAPTADAPARAALDLSHQDQGETSRSAAEIDALRDPRRGAPPPALLREQPAFSASNPFAPSPGSFDFAKLSVPPPSEGIANADPGTLRPSQVDRTPSIPAIPAQRSRARILQAAAVACALAIVGAAWLQLRPQAQPQARPANAALPAPAAEKPARIVANPGSTPGESLPPVPAAGEATSPIPNADAPLTPEAAAAASAVPDLTSAFAAALSATPGSIAVTVRVTPAGSIIFDHGKRIGTDVVQINVEPGGKKNLVALLDGYLPRRFTVDGSVNSVSIALRPALPAAGAPPVAPAANPMAPAVQAPVAQDPAAPRTAPPTKPAAPAKPGPKEAFDPSRDVGAL
jgi:hypothetical protein